MNRSKAKFTWFEKLDNRENDEVTYKSQDNQQYIGSPWQCLGQSMAIATDLPKRARL